MKEFQIFRYLNKWKYLIVALTFIGSLGVYFYATSNQRYTAQTIIEYTNEGAVNGLAPNGSKLDASEIYSSTVITDVLSDLNLSSTMESIRANCLVDEIIPEDEEDKKAAAIDKGEEYVFYATQFKVSFSAASEVYARDVLDSIIQNYFAFYSEKYVDEQVLPNNSVNVLNGTYDYIEAAEIIEASVFEIKDYLRVKGDNNSSYRSSRTGYCFNDLNDIYEYIYDNDIPELFASILEVCSTEDKEVLVKKYEDEINKYDLEIKNLNEELTELKDLIDQYTDKSDESMKYHFDFGDDSTDDNDYILKDVQGDKDGYEKTAYDQMIQRYVSLVKQRDTDKIEKEHSQYILNIFRKSNVQKTDIASGSTIRQKIDSLVYELNDYYTIVKDTACEFNEYQGAENVKSVNTIAITAAINVKLYMLLAVILFVFVGCVGAVVLGRFGDLIDYLMFTDRKTKLPNRSKCDLVIEKIGEYDILPDDFSVVFIKLEIAQKYDRAAGDQLLADFGAILKHAGKGYGFIGYNDANQFLCLFEKCKREKADTFAEVVAEHVKAYNEDNSAKPISYKSAIANTKTDGIYEIRKLIRCALGKIVNDQQR